jgi:LacI family repressor for deo operon, udp, cdd, tsx, nupC, and nupG
MGLMSTIEQVALLAKVSVATVSRVVNKSARVSEDTRKRVQEAIDKLNYQPNAFGTYLRKINSNMVLILLHSVDNPFFAQTVQGIEKIAHEHDYNILLGNTYGDLDREQRYIKMLKNHLLDGIILISNTLGKDDLNELHKLYPIVQVIEYIPESDAPYFTIDFYEAATVLMTELIESGHKKIAFIHTGSTSIISATEKHRAYVDVLTKNNLPVLNNGMIEHLFGYSSARAITKELLQDDPEITGFFTTSDLIAVGVMDELKDQGININSSLCVTGFDNTIFSSFNNPSIPTVDLDSFKLGKQAMEYLLFMIHNPKKEKEAIASFQEYSIIRHR